MCVVTHLLNSTKCICWLQGSSKQGLCFCLVEILFFFLITKMLALLQGRTSQDSLSSIETSGVWHKYWITVVGLISPDTRYLWQNLYVCTCLQLFSEGKQMSRDHALFHHKEMFGTRGDECLRATELASVAGFSGIYFSLLLASINQKKKWLPKSRTVPLLLLTSYWDVSRWQIIC